MRVLFGFGVFLPKGVNSEREINSSIMLKEEMQMQFFSSNVIVEFEKIDVDNFIIVLDC